MGAEICATGGFDVQSAGLSNFPSPAGPTCVNSQPAGFCLH